MEGQERNRRPIEIDVVAELADGTMLTGEIKWSRRPYGVDLYHDLERDLVGLANSGHHWARAALRGQFLSASAAGFDDEMRRLATRDTRLHLIDLDALYASPSAADRRVDGQAS
jgi:hypothetical protein